MKIGIYDPYLDDCGGGEKYMMTIAQCLSKAHEVSVFWNKKSDLDQVIERFNLDLGDVLLTENIFSSNTNFLKRIQESRKYDAIIFLSDGSIPFVLSKKLFIHIQQPLKTLQKNTLKNKLKISRVTSFFVNSSFTKTFINYKFHLKTQVVYPPVDSHPVNAKKENIILHVGRFRIIDKTNGVNDYKKQSVMISAFKNMIDQGLKGWEFVLAVSVKDEDHADFEEIKKGTKNYPIRFIFNETNQQLWKTYSQAKIYWHASGFGEDLKKNPQFAEHFGISTVEAMGAGAVPVVINEGGQREIVFESINGFVWDTIEELQQKTLKLISNPQLLKKLSEQAVKRAQFFAGDRFCQEVKKLVST